MIEYLEHSFIHLRVTSYICSVCNVRVRGYFEYNTISNAGSLIYLDVYQYGLPLILTCKEQIIKNLLE
jgi:hypothetical protein